MLGGLGVAGNGLGCGGAAAAGVVSTGALEGSTVVTAGGFSTAGLGGVIEGRCVRAWTAAFISQFVSQFIYFTTTCTNKCDKWLHHTHA
jgi:hypothetical protein